MNCLDCPYLQRIATVTPSEDTSGWFRSVVDYYCGRVSDQEFIAFLENSIGHDICACDVGEE